jgi:hypothetical protein
MSPDQRAGSAAITVVNRATVRGDAAAAFDLVTNLEREQEWNDKLLEAARVSGRPLAAGCRYRARFPWPAGESVITYDDVDAPRRWSTHSTARWLDVELHGDVIQAGDVCEVVLATSLRPRGPLRPLRRMIARTMEDGWNHHLDVIRRIIENPAAHSR